MTTENVKDEAGRMPRADRPKEELPIDPGEYEAAAWLADGMGKFDALFEPDAPDAARLELFVRESRREARRKLWRDLALLWTVGCVVLTGMSFLLAEDLTAFVAVQAAGSAAGLLWLAVSALRNPGGRWKDEWTE